jgi:enoyl-CoA hydratase/carnithine racemase
LLPRLVGEQRSRTFFFENQIWSSEEALNAGAIDEVVEADELINRSIEVATNWSQWGNHFREATKHLLQVQSQNDFETHLKHEQTLIEAAGTTSEFKEGVINFLKQRK